MRRHAALLAVLLASPALAAGPGEGVEMRLAGAFGISLTVDVNRNVEQTGVGPHTRETSMAGLAWQREGFKLSAAAGLFGYAFAGAGEGTARIVSFAVAHEFTTVLGGTLSAELRQSRLWDDTSQLDITSARLGWSLRF